MGQRPASTRWWAATVSAVLISAFGLAVPAHAQGAVRRADAPTAVRDSYLVVFKDAVVGRAGVRTKATGLAARFGGTVGRTYSHALRGFEVTVAEPVARRLAADPSVAYVEQNHMVSITDTQAGTSQWGIDRIDQRLQPVNDSYTYPSTGAGVRVYILDTGIQLNHRDFTAGQLVSGFDAIDGGTADDANGHGTHVAGIVGSKLFGVAKGATLVAVRVLDASGQGTVAQVLAGIDWVTGDHDPGELAVANMSLGAAGTALNAAVASSIADGITYTVAAGNEATDACTRTPASAPDALTVGATDNTDQQAWYSNFGACLDLFAPGSFITSTWLGAPNGSRSTQSGTSMASPHVAGAAAIVLAMNPTFTPQQVRDWLVNNATPNVVIKPGAGSPNRLLYVVNGMPGNDFQTRLNPSLRSIPQGAMSVSIVVSSTTTTGPAQLVTFSADRLPAGTSATFAPQSLASGGSTTLTITTSAATPIGQHRVLVIGTGLSTYVTPFLLIVTAPA